MKNGVSCEVLCRKSCAKHMARFWLKPGIFKLRPAGQIQPTKPFHSAREAISSSHSNILWRTKKIIYLRKNCSFGTVHCNISRNIRKMSGPQTIVQELMWPSNKKFGDPWLKPKLHLNKKWSFFSFRISCASMSLSAFLLIFSLGYKNHNKN